MDTRGSGLSGSGDGSSTSRNDNSGNENIYAQGTVMFHL